MIDDLTKDERGKLVKVNMQGRYWNWKNLLTMTLPEITSSLSNDVKNIIIETSQAEVPATPDRVIGGTALGTTAGFSVFEPYRLSGPETPRFSFDVAEPPSTGGKKSKSAIEIVEKEEKRRERERREVQKKAKREALEEQKKAMKDRERRRRKEEAQKSKEAEKQRKEKAKRYQQHQQEKAEASAVAAKTKTKVKSPKSKQRSPSAADLKKKGDEMWEKAMGMINQKGSTSSATQQAVEAAKKLAQVPADYHPIPRSPTGPSRARDNHYTKANYSGASTRSDTDTHRRERRSSVGRLQLEMQDDI